MIWLVALVGLSMVVLGIGILLHPERLRRALYWFLDPRNIYPVAAIRIGSGILFLMASPYTFLPTLIAGLGMVFIAAGITVPLLGRARLERVEQWWLTVSDRVLRLWGLAAAVVGALVVWTTIRGGL